MKPFTCLIRLHPIALHLAMLTKIYLPRFVRQRPWLIAIFFSWIMMYIYSEKGEAEHNTAIFLEIIYFFGSFCVVFFNLITLRIRFGDTSLIVFLFLFVGFFGSRSLIYHADMTAKSIYFSLFQDQCRPMKSDYLNSLGIKFCYGWAYYPQARLILLSPNVNLSKAVNNWPSPVIAAFSQDIKLLNWFVNCKPVDVNKPVKDIYYLRVYCE